MKKQTIKIIGISLLLIFLQINTAFAEFKDVTTDNPNYATITYLQQQNILNGYPDGSFKPNNAVNRAEFLKIVIEGSKITSNITTKIPFDDVPDNAWYAKYVKKAYFEGWIVGYPDGTFKPEQTINKAEALKILGKIQSWKTKTYITENPYSDVWKTAWYTPFVAYAKEYNYLEETSANFFPDTLMTRAKVSEIIYRTFISNGKVYQLSENTTPTVEENKNPLPYDLISSNTFKSITLNNNIPNTFYKDEIYVISGHTTESESTSIAAVLDDTNRNNYKVFATDLKNGDFSISVSFNKSGNYYIGLIPDTLTTNNAVEISVLSKLPNNKNTGTVPTKPQAPQMNSKNDRTSISFPLIQNSLTKIILSQNDKKVTYYTRQNVNSLEVNYSDFQYFSKGKVSVSLQKAVIAQEKPLEILSDFSQQSTAEFTVTEHNYDINDETKISVNPPVILSGIQKISFSGKILTDGQLNAYITKPDGFVETVELESTDPTYNDNIFGEILKKGGNFTFTYTPEKQGTYTVEINDKNGFAAINHPIYIKNGFPLIPDYFDLEQKELFKFSDFNLAQLRQELFNYINTSRNQQNLSPVILSSELNLLAQSHSDEMAENNYINHVDLNGDGPDQRRIKMGIKTGVSENLAQDISIRSSHLSLMRSAAHRNNILDSAWTRVGLGIAYSDGYLYVTEEFSYNEITPSDLITFKNDLFSEINKKRQENDLFLLEGTTNLNLAAAQLNNKILINKTQITNSDLREVQSEYSLGTITVTTVNSALWPGILGNVINDETILESGWTQIGLDLQADSNGILYLLVLLNRP